MSLSKNKYLFIFLLLFFGCKDAKKSDSIKSDFSAKVIGVKDGDTIEVLYKNKPIVIRLEHIDCPEKKQPFGKKAKQFVSTKIFGEKVKIKTNGKTDRWKRMIGVVILDNGDNLNKLLVKNGLAMHYKKYSKDNSYDLIEKKAQNEKVGLWSQKNVVKPWEYRKNKK
jgi:endonuclease YncB( thermonuclease family)